MSCGQDDERQRREQPDRDAQVEREVGLRPRYLNGSQKFPSLDWNQVGVGRDLAQSAYDLGVREVRVDRDVAEEERRRCKEQQDDERPGDLTHDGE